MQVRGALAAAALLVGAPLAAESASLFDFGMGQADAHVPMGNTWLNIWMSKKEDAFLIQPNYRTAFTGGGHYPDATWKSVAEAFVYPARCGISTIRPLSRAGASWIAYYVCPAGVDLKALVREQRKALQNGEQLRPVS